MKPRPRPLTGPEARASVDSGSRWAWALEPKLAVVYETAIAEAYAGAADALEARSSHLTAAGLTPEERRQAQDATRAASKAANERHGAKREHSDWSMPNEDELGDALRKKYEQRADDASVAIRVEAMRRVTKAGLDLMHVNLEVVNPLLEGVISQLGGNIEIADTTRRDVMRSLESSWKDGDSIPKAAAKLRAAGAEISKSRSVLIARTELIGAINAGAHALGTISNDYTPAGEPPLLKVWLTAEDEKVRDSHVQAGEDYGEGQGIALDAPFQVGDSSMQFPGDQNGAAEEVCNCRCALSYEEGALTASEHRMDLTFKGHKLRATGALTAAGVALYELDPADLPDAVDPAPALDTPSDVAIEDVAMDAPVRAWTAVLAVTGEETSDGRMLMPGGIRHRELPLTLTMQLELAPEHSGALVVGRIDEIEFMPADAAVSAGLMPEQDGGYAADAEAIVGRGVWDDSFLGDEAMRLVADEMLRGVSIDLAPDAVEVIEKAPLEGEEYGSLLELVTSGEIMGATVCAHPAFAEANIMVEPVLVASVYPSPNALSVYRVLTRFGFVAPKLPAVPALRAAAVDYSDHSMIAVHPTSAECAAIAQPGGQPAGDLHVTLAYLPNPEGVDFDALHKVVSGVAAQHSTIAGKVSGAGYFAPSDPPPADPDAKPEDDAQAKADDAKPSDGPESVTAADAPPVTPGPVADPETPADSEDGGDGQPEPMHPHVALVDAPGLSRMQGALCNALDDAGIEYASNHDFVPHLTLGYEAAPAMPAMHVAGSGLTFSHLAVHQGPTRTDHPMGDVEPDGLTASAAGMAPLEPPTSWFTDPVLDEPTPLTITEEGRIYGHLATWGTCHVGIRDACVQPPTSETDYALFHLGHVQAIDEDTGDRHLVPVGTFQMDTNHAPLSMGMRAAQGHYDHTGTAVADVRVGEDEHGIWFAGAIRPDLSAVKVRALRAAQISGDWRAHEGGREFCAGLAVNIPGFPVVRPRTAIAASGQVLALVAAGVDLHEPAEVLAARRLRATDRLIPGFMAGKREAALERMRA